MPSRRTAIPIEGDPHASFRFMIEIGGVPHGVFTECTLPSIEWETQEIKEGGQNTYTHQLPSRRKGTKITLKKGLVKEELLAWYADMMSERFEEIRKTVDITLFDATHKPVIKWSCADAYPTKWSGPDLKTQDNAVATQTLELACASITFEQQQG
jgi:phage tail-like protein